MKKWRHLLEPLIQKSINPIPWDVALLQDVVLFEGKESVIVANKSQVKNMKALQIWLAAGNMAEIDSLYAELETYAQKNGYQAITYVGRKGWLKTHGFREDCVVGIKEIL